MPNKILKIVLNKNRGLVGEMQLDLYELDLLKFPSPFALRNSLKFNRLRQLFK